ncbi:MAG: VTT domain-containing protein [Actinobacteria bacterium]|nr:VTT domain-containing protein [Actinomycetota bacterium]
MFGFLQALGDVLLALFAANPYPALALLIGIEESGLPLPIPGDLVLVHAGAQASLGAASPVVLGAVGAAAATLGASVLYWLARWFGRPLIDRFGGLLRLTPERRARVERWVQDRAVLAIAGGRFIPGMRVVLSVAARLARVPFARFVAAVAIAASL